MKAIRLLAAGLIVCGCAASSCTSLSPDVKTAAHEAAALPSRYAVTAGGTPLTNAWWRTFGSDELDTLMSRAFQGNLTVAAAESRLRQARAAAVKAGAAAYPEVTGSASASVARRQRVSADGNSVTTRSEDYSLGLAASYEVDLWGRVHAVTASAGLGAVASQCDLETACMTISGQVADRWLQLIEANAQVEVIRGQIETSERLLALLRLRMIKTSTTALLDVYQQEESLRGVEASLPPARQRVELLRNELAILLGLPAGSDVGVAGRTLPPLPPAPAAGVPAELLVRRPDVRAELARLAAAGWNVAAARADRLPALRLTGSAGFGATKLADVLDNWLPNLAAGLAGPVLDGGRRRAEVERTLAALDEQLVHYRQTILTSAREVEDALVQERRLTERRDALRRERESANRALEEARRRYLKGGVGYLPVLTALRSVQALQRDTVTAEREVLTNRVSLYRALGGDWSTTAGAVGAQRMSGTPSGARWRPGAAKDSAQPGQGQRESETS